MNKVVMIFGVLIAFLIPIGVVISMNLDQFSGQDSANTKKKSNGKLVYYYTPS